MAGGVESGFTHVERDTWPTRLLHVKGRRNVRVLEVPLALSSLNRGDVFILDAGLALYVWNGEEASRAEKAKGAQVAHAIKDDERGGRATVHVLADGESSVEAEQFFSALGWTGAVADAPVASADDGGADDAAEEAAAPRLFAASADGQSLKEVQEKPLEKRLLHSTGVYVLTSGGAAYAWVGKAAPQELKLSALALAGKGAAAGACAVLSITCLL